MIKTGFVFPKEVLGYLSATEGKLLYQLAQTHPGLGTVVELGAYQGKSIICLAQGSKMVHAGNIYTVDNFIGDKYVGYKTNYYQELIKNINRYHLEKDVVIIRGDIQVVAGKWHQPIRLLFIDADHTYQAVSTDFWAWGKYLVSGGIVAFHDSLCWFGVCKFIIKLIMNGQFTNWHTLVHDSMGLTYATNQKEKRAGWLKYQYLVTFLIHALPRIPVFIRAEVSLRDKTDFWYQLFEFLAKLWKKLQRRS